MNAGADRHGEAKTGSALLYEGGAAASALSSQDVDAKPSGQRTSIGRGIVGHPKLKPPTGIVIVAK